MNSTKPSLAPAWIAVAILLALSPAVFALQITHDAAWQMWIGRQMLHGADLYTDIIEVNPPLWFWLAQPLSAISTFTGIHDVNVLVVFFLVSIAASILLNDALISDWPKWRRTLFLIAFVLVTPPGNFGQREHFTFVAVTPYVLLIQRRRSDMPVAAGLATWIGLYAAVGFALKPHFALVPIALELWLRKSPLRVEVIALVVASAIYAASVLMFEPDYFTEALPLVLRAYGQFAPINPVALLPSALPFVLALGVLPNRNASSAALLVASLVFYLVYVLQLKGFAYQAIPAMGMLVLALAASAPSEMSVRAAIAAAAAVLAVTPNLRPYNTTAWADVPRGASYAALSVAPRAGWPLVEERGLKWPLRSMSLWMAPDEKDGVRAWVTRDLRCNPPTYLLVDDRRVNFSAIFADVLAHYETVRSYNGLKEMKLVRSMQTPHDCRTVY